MKAKYLIFAFFLALLMLLLPLAALAEAAPLSPAIRLNVFISYMTSSGEMALYGPAVPLSNSPNEDRLWLKVPPEVFSTGRMGILIEDMLGQFVTFDPANGSILENISDIGDNLDTPSVIVYMFDDSGIPVGTCSLYFSSQNGPMGTMSTEELTTLRKGKEESEQSSISVTAPDIDDLGKWSIKSYVDRFGDTTSDKYIEPIRDIHGTFSNSATTNSELRVCVLIDREGSEIGLRKGTRIAIMLFEYGDYQVKSSYGRDYEIYVKDSEGSKFSVNGSLNGDRIFINKSEVETLLNALYKEGEVKFVIEEQGSVDTYNFTLDASKFPNAFIRLIMDESERDRETVPRWAKEMLKLLK